jgi:hypothetical protein
MLGYRESVESILDTGQPDGPAAPDVALPGRRLRRVAVAEQRIGPFDFLATIGCPLSEVVAERNAPLGRVLEPTRRLMHELRVIHAMEECLPTLRAERAERLRDLLKEKQSDLGAHIWNAVWLDEDLERFRQAGPRSLLGGDDASDGTRQLRRAAVALEASDVASLEAAFAQLRDDRAVGPLLRASSTLTAELERVTGRLALAEVVRCDRREQSLARIFTDRFAPLQTEIGLHDRRSGELALELGRLFDVSARAVRVPDAMQVFQRDVIGNEPEMGLWGRQRRAILAHAEAWGPVLRACGVIPPIEA